MGRVLFMGPSQEHPASPEYVDIASCHSTWSFDVRNHRFRRILRGFESAVNQPVTEWRPYYGLEEHPASDSFVVWLNPEGTRLLRSWRHRPDCPSCADQNTREVTGPGACALLPPGDSGG
ncbi:MAG TPA: hypothetical protein DCQ30_09515 [Acidimicrobiaceae bacterium]|nr:hypothetical protein [Acidimicrobiaceae bacterium]